MNVYYERLAADLEFVNGELRDRVHVPMTYDTGKVAFDYVQGQADFVEHTAAMHAIKLAQSAEVMVSLSDFRRVNPKVREVGCPLKLGAVSINNMPPLPEPSRPLDGYLLHLSGEGAVALHGLVLPNQLVELGAPETGYSHLAAYAVSEAVYKRVTPQRHQALGVV